MRPVVLVDSAVLDGSARAFPLEWLSGCDVRPYAPRALLQCDRSHAEVAQAVLVRSMSRVGEAELAALPALSAVATLSSGTDHLDESALRAAGVRLYTGHGGNARAVADWVQWALDRLGPPGPLTVLVVGVGAVGGLVADRLLAAGHRVLPCDPPLADAPQTAFARPWVTLAQGVAHNPDVVTMHVPLTKGGAHPTYGLLDTQHLDGWARPGCLLLNAARGGILDEASAAELVRTGRLRLALDTFAGEPRPNAGTLAACALATPHIAGHSIEGKLDVARRAVAALLAHVRLPEPPPLARTVADALARLAGADLVADSALDRCATQFARAPGEFERLRHGHLRRERLPLPE